MSLFVQVVNEEVKQVWDTQPPAGEEGWKSAVEVKPDLTAERQVYDGHTFDISVDPVQIVYAVRDITVDERKGSLIGQAQAAYRSVVQAEMQKEIEVYQSLLRLNHGMMYKKIWVNSVNTLDKILW